MAKKKNEKENLTFPQQIVSWVKTLLGAIVVVMLINGLLVASFVVPTGSMENTVMTGDFLFVNKFIYGPSSPQVIPFLNIPIPFFRFPGIKDPEKNDVIVFIYPGERDDVKARNFQYYLKRCVATAGDSLKLVNNELFVNGEKADIPEHCVYDPNNPGRYATFPIGVNHSHTNYKTVKVPKIGDVIPLDNQNYTRWYVFVKREGHSMTRSKDKIYIDGKEVTSYTVEKNYCFGMGDNRDNSSDSRFWGFIPYENVVGTPLVVYWSWATNLKYTSIIDKIKSIRWSRIGTLID